MARSPPGQLPHAVLHLVGSLRRRRAAQRGDRIAQPRHAEHARPTLAGRLARRVVQGCFDLAPRVGPSIDDIYGAATRCNPERRQAGPRPADPGFLVGGKESTTQSTEPPRGHLDDRAAAHRQELLDGEPPSAS